jgi:hypothetical protein
MESIPESWALLFFPAHQLCPSFRAFTAYNHFRRVAEASLIYYKPGTPIVWLYQERIRQHQARYPDHVALPRNYKANSKPGTPIM